LLFGRIVAFNMFTSIQLMFCPNLPLQDAVQLVQSVTDAQEAAKKLTEEAYNRGSADNITCVVVRFLH
jgi:serine/threonine protein phosphatase PrpC